MFSQSRSIKFRLLTSELLSLWQQPALQIMWKQNLYFFLQVSLLSAAAQTCCLSDLLSLLCSRRLVSIWRDCQSSFKVFIHFASVLDNTNISCEGFQLFCFLSAAANQTYCLSLLCSCRLVSIWRATTKGTESNVKLLWIWLNWEGF